MAKTLLLTCGILLIGILADAQPAGLVKVKDHHFYIADKPYRFIGVNYWYGALLGTSDSGKQRLKTELDFLKSKGVNNLRVLAVAEGEGIINAVNRVEPVYQPRLGVFNKDLLKGLDYLLAEMGKRDMKAVLYLGNNWEWSGGFLQYLNWNKLIPDSVLRRKLGWTEYREYVSKFYSCEPCVTQQQIVVGHIVNRVNAITGKKYKNDPAIMSWELANEPRPMTVAAIPAYQKWIATSAALIKSYDNNHLVTTGTEGYMGTETIDNYATIHADKNIDYATIHIWPKNWSWFKDSSMARSLDSVVEKTMTYIDKHAAVMLQLNKPLVIEEFGMPRDEHRYDLAATTHSRDHYFESVFAKLYQQIASGGVVNGVNFWGFGGIGRASHKQVFWQTGEDLLADPPMEEQGLNTVFDADKTTWELVTKYLDKIKKVK